MSKEVVPIRDPGKITAMARWLRGSPGGRRDEAMLLVGVNCGLRISDLLALTVGDVADTAGGAVRIRDGVDLVEAKTGKRRRLAVNRAAKEVLAAYLGGRQDGGPPDPGAPLFPSRKGGGPLGRQQAHRLLAAAGRAVGLAGVGTHSLRKTFGYHVYRRSGGNLGLVQRLLNHSRSGDTLRYIGIDQETMDAATLELNLR
jgi:integrase